MGKAKRITATRVNIIVNDKTLNGILRTINRIDDTGTADLLDDPNIQELEDWVSKPVSRTNADGSRTVVRGPIAPSLQDYLREAQTADRVVWETVIDENTGELDAELDGTEWDYNDPRKPEAPLHIHCRCRYNPIPNTEGVYNGGNPKEGEV